MDDYEKNHKYQKYPYPPTWDDTYSVEKYIVPPMNIVSLFIVRNTVQLTLNFISLRNKGDKGNAMYHYTMQPI